MSSFPCTIFVVLSLPPALEVALVADHEVAELSPGVVLIADREVAELSPEVVLVAEREAAEHSPGVALVVDHEVAELYPGVARVAVAIWVDSPGRPKFLAFPNVDQIANPSSSVEVVG